jgi:hypothetical protein
MSRFKVVMTSQLYPSVEIERQMLEAVGARLEIASGERSDIERLAHDADALLTHLVDIDHDFISAVEHLANRRPGLAQGSGLRTPLPCSTTDQSRTYARRMLCCG